MPENKEFVLTAGSHAVHHEGIGRNQKDTENRQDKEGEEEIDYTSQQEAAVRKSLGHQEKDRQNDRYFQGRGHSNTPRLGESGVTDNSFIGLTNKEADNAAKRRSQKDSEHNFVGIVVN